MSRFEPPPSILEMINVEMAGTNTMVTPEVIPGRLRGTITRKRVATPLQPRSEAASITLLSIFTITE